VPTLFSCGVWITSCVCLYSTSHCPSHAFTCIRSLCSLLLRRQVVSELVLHLDNDRLDALSARWSALNLQSATTRQLQVGTNLGAFE
jgi:hypothetical protein